MEQPPSQRLFKWQLITLATLLIGYAGYYLCRSDLSVAGPKILDEFGPQGWNKKTLGSIVSIGTFFYAIGKVTNGLLADFLSSRAVFLWGMAASAVCTIAFGAGTTFTALAIAWSCNRFVQSAGWGALVKLASRWFPSNRHGLVMGLLCLSYLPGDAFARFSLSLLLGWIDSVQSSGASTAITSSVGSWRVMFFVAALVLLGIAVVSWKLLRESPTELHLAEPAANPQNVFGEKGNIAKPIGLVDLIKPLLGSFAFWLILYMSFGLTLVRDAFNTWIPIYLTEECGLDAVRAGMSSAIVPLVGGIPAVGAGLMADRLAARGRGLIMLTSLCLMTVSLVALAQLTSLQQQWISLSLMCAAFFFLMGPYTFLTGVISLDFGGKRGAATAAGLTDAAGYLGAVLSGRWIGGIAEDYGWSTAFGVLASITLLTSLAAVGFWIWHDLRPPRTFDVSPLGLVHASSAQLRRPGC